MDIFYRCICLFGCVCKRKNFVRSLYIQVHTHKGCEVICFFAVQIVFIFWPCRARFCRKWAWGNCVSWKEGTNENEVVDKQDSKVLKGIAYIPHPCLFVSKYAARKRGC